MINGNNNIRLIDNNIFSSLHNIQGAAYDNKAKLYEKLVSIKMYNKIIWGTLPKDYTDFAEKVILNLKGNCIDIGCGGLIQTGSIYGNTKQDFILLDHSVEMLKIARQRLIALCGKVPDNINLLQADAFSLPFESESFDNLVSFGMIHCFENKKAFVSETLRVLKSGSSFNFTTMTSDRLISKFYMNLLRKKKEFGEPLSSKQILNLFEGLKKVDYYMKGSMIFITGIK